MKFNEVAINQNFKTLKQITDLYDDPKDLCKIYTNMGIGYPNEHSADTFSTRLEKEANSQLVKYPDDLLRDRVGSCIEHALFMHYFCEASGIYSKIVIYEVIAEYEDIYYRWGHAVCFIKLDENKTGIFLMDHRNGDKWIIRTVNCNLEETIKLLKKVMKLSAQRTVLYDRSFLSSIFKTIYNVYYVGFDRYSSLGKAYASHYNKKDISRIDFYYKYIFKEFKKKYGKDFINSDIEPKKYVYINTDLSLLENIYDSILIILRTKII